MLGVTDLGGFLVGLAVIILMPGPNSLYVLSVAARRGIRTGYAAASGVFIGDAVLIFLTAIGVASVLAANPMIFTAVQWIGAAYLAFLAIMSLRAAWRQWRQRRLLQDPADTSPMDLVRLEAAGIQPAELDVAAAAAASRRPARPEKRERPFRRALVVSLLNPKAILFMFAFFVQFVDPTYEAPALTFLLLGTILEVASALYLTTLILVGARLADVVRKRPLVAAGGNAAIGTVFLGFAAKLVTTAH
ncbi:MULTISPECIES: leucine efflux protein LeuE [unclassified Agrococcus]|uniref:leucine efflux protein LeuE n=1 Tax=unclassified Agrococcus TaxID=2615065 RepID=UPI0036104031